MKSPRPAFFVPDPRVIPLFLWGISATVAAVYLAMALIDERHAHAFAPAQEVAIEANGPR